MDCNRSVRVGEPHANKNAARTAWPSPLVCIVAKAPGRRVQVIGKFANQLDSDYVFAYNRIIIVFLFAFSATNRSPLSIQRVLN